MHDKGRFGIFLAFERGLKILVAGLGLGFVGLFYLIAYRRFRFPLELEWAEGGVMDMVRRLVSHQPLYVAPTKDFIPFMYTPGYYYVSFALGHFTGMDLMTLRLVSIAATTGCLAMIFAYVRRSTGDLFAAWVSSGVFAALYGQASGWFDLARVDMLYLFFLLVAIYLSRRGWPIWAAIAFAIAFQTKQSGLIVAAFVLAHETRRPRKLLQGLGVFTVLAGGSALLLNWQSHGWYRYHTVFLPGHHVWIPRKFISFSLHDLIAPLGMTLLLILVAALLASSEGRDQDAEAARNRRFLLFATIGITLGSLTARLHLGGTTNVTLPLYAWICILLGLSLHALKIRAASMPGEMAQILRIGVLAACVVQFAQLEYVPSTYIPSEIQVAEAKEVQRKIEALPGKIFVLHAVIDAGSMDKEGFANSMAVWDVLRADHTTIGQNLRAQLIQSFQNKEYTAILADGPPDQMLPEEAEFLKEVTDAAKASYPVETRLLDPVQSMLFYTNPLTLGIKPTYLYTPQ